MYSRSQRARNGMDSGKADGRQSGRRSDGNRSSLRHSHSQIMQLQRLIGNRRTGQFLGIQREIGPDGDGKIVVSARTGRRYYATHRGGDGRGKLYRLEDVTDPEHSKVVSEQDKKYVVESGHVSSGRTRRDGYADLEEDDDWSVERQRQIGRMADEERRGIGMSRAAEVGGSAAQVALNALCAALDIAAPGAGVGIAAGITALDAVNNARKQKRQGGSAAKSLGASAVETGVMEAVALIPIPFLAEALEASAHFVQIGKTMLESNKSRDLRKIEDARNLSEKMERGMEAVEQLIAIIQQESRDENGAIDGNDMERLNKLNAVHTQMFAAKKFADDFLDSMENEGRTSLLP